MFGHLPELIIILVIALIVFGPERLPEVARTVGKTVRELREAAESALHPPEEDDFSTYYYESLARAGESPSTEPPEGHQDADTAHEPLTFPLSEEITTVPAGEPEEVIGTPNAPAPPTSSDNR